MLKVSGMVPGTTRQRRIGETDMATQVKQSPNKPPSVTTQYPEGTPVPEHPECNFGPFGDKALHGTALVVDSAKATPKKDGPPYKALHWTFTFWAPANVEELKRLVDAKP